MVAEQTQPTFQQTEVGLIPSDWEVKELGNIAEIKRGKFTPRPRNDPRFYGGNIPFVQTGDVTNSGGTIQNYTQTLNQEGLSVSKLFQKGTILMTIAANIGYTGILQIAMACPDSLVAIDAFKDYDNGYLNHYFTYRRRYIEELSTPGAQKNLNVEILKALSLPVPPTPAEQTAIATALSGADALISQLEKLIAKKIAIKQGAMQELLRPKDGWEEKTLGACLKRKPDYGINASAVSYSSDLPTYLRITDITEDSKYSKENIVSVKNMYSYKYYLESGDLVIARTGASVGKSYLYNASDGALVFAGFLIRVKPDPQLLSPEYLSFYLQTSTYWRWINSNSMRTGQPGINGAECMGMPISLPRTLDEQTRIAQILSDMDAGIEKLEQQLAKQRQIKQGMMQALLTGKIRLV